MTEAQIQQQIILYARNELKAIAFSVPNEASYQNKKFSNTGVLKGVSDLIVILPNRILFIEVKAKTKQSEYQIKFETNVKKMGFEYYIVKSLEDFKNIL